MTLPLLFEKLNIDFPNLQERARSDKYSPNASKFKRYGQSSNVAITYWNNSDVGIFLCKVKIALAVK